MKKTELNGYVYDRYSWVFNEKEWDNIKCLDLKSKYFLQKCCFFGCNVFSVNLLKCVSMNNQECRTRTKKMDINSHKSIFYPYIIWINKCSSSCKKNG